jgi:uncharacterized protein
MATPPVIPLFPLGSQLVPGLLMPLYLFEDRYRQLARDLAEASPQARHFGVVGIRAGREVGQDGASSLFEVGTLAEVTELDGNPDGTFNLQAVGGRRFQLLELDYSKPYLQARVQFLDEPDGDGAEEAARPVRRALEAYRDAVGLRVDPAGLDPRLLSYIVAAAMVIPPEEKQELLAAPDTAARLRLAHRRLRQELRIIGALASLPAVDLVNTATSAN